MAWPDKEHAEGAEKPIVPLGNSVSVQPWIDEDFLYMELEGIDAAIAILEARAVEQFMEEQRPERRTWLS